MTNRELEFLKEKYSGDALNEAIERFEGGEPLAYVLGEWYFYGLTFKLNDACLIPRPDTEHIVEKSVETIKKGGVFADLCTGSGCIAISVLANRPDLTCSAYDISEKALEKARENASLNGVSERADFVQADVFELELAEGSLDCIISNPPYIQTYVIDTLETVQREPRIALDGGADGLDFYRHIIEHFTPALKPDGCFIFEIGYDQGDAIRALASSHSLSCSVFKDYGGNDRCAVLKRRYALS
jgi:release factor glutamine methyltransferase